jgi:hypothetical protein
LTVAASSGSLVPDTVCSNATALLRGFQFSSNLAADHSVSVRPLPLNSSLFNILENPMEGLLCEIPVVKGLDVKTVA